MSDASVWSKGTRVIPLVNADSTLAFQPFTATAGQKLFNLTNFQYVPDVGSLLIFINGVLQTYAVDYFESSASSFQLVEGAEDGDLVLALGFVGIVGNITVIQGTVSSVNGRTGIVILNSADITAALGFTPIGAARGAVVNPALGNLWVDVGFGDQRIGYYKDASGVVHLEGHCKNGTLGTIAFTLPAGFTPVNTLYFPVWSGSAANEHNVSVGFDGTVTLNGIDNSFYSLDGISFRTN